MIMVLIKATIVVVVDFEYNIVLLFYLVVGVK